MSNKGRMTRITALTRGEPFLFIYWIVRKTRRGRAASSVVADATPAALTRVRGGGAYRDRTDDLMLAKQPLSQLS